MRPLIFAHRGARAVTPENTLPAFRRAVELGADGIEFDVQLSADGVPVVIHDATVDKTTDGSGAVADMTLDQLKTLDAGSYFDTTFAGTRIPTLEEVLAALPNHIWLNIELKGTAVAALPPAVVSALGARQERVIISSFNPLMLGPLTDIQRALLTIEGIGYDGWRRDDISAWHPHYSALTAEDVNAAHADDLAVNVWTVNTHDDIHRMTQLGVDGIITDYPDIVLDVI